MIVKERENCWLIRISGQFQLKNLPLFRWGVKGKNGSFLGCFLGRQKTLDKGEITPYTA